MSEITYTAVFENGEEVCFALELDRDDASAEEIRAMIECDLADRLCADPQDRETDFGAILQLSWE